MKNVMTKAWEIAKQGQEKFGGKVKEYFAQALRMAWAIIKKGGIELKGSEKQVKWAKEIKRIALQYLDLLQSRFIRDAKDEKGRRKAVRFVELAKAEVNKIEEAVTFINIRQIKGIIDFYEAINIIFDTIDGEKVDALVEAEFK